MKPLPGKIETLFVAAIRKAKTENVQRILDEEIPFCEYHKDKLPARAKVRIGLLVLGVKDTTIDPVLVMRMIKQARPEIADLIWQHPYGKTWLKQTLRDLEEKYL